MPTQYASCPCCGRTVPLGELNFDVHGNRVTEPKLYGAFLKTRTQNARGRMEWTAQDMPVHMLPGLIAQVAAALGYLQRLAGDFTNGDS